MNWIIGIVFVLGMSLAMNEGDYFPWANLLGFLLMLGMLRLMRR